MTHFLLGLAVYPLASFLMVMIIMVWMKIIERDRR